MKEENGKITFGEATLAEDFDSEEAIDNEIGPLAHKLRTACIKHNLAFIGVVCYRGKKDALGETVTGLLLSTNFPPARVPLEMLGAMRELTKYTQEDSREDIADKMGGKE